jgi:hypothetical protein
MGNASEDWANTWKKTAENYQAQRENWPKAKTKRDGYTIMSQPETASSLLSEIDRQAASFEAQRRHNHAIFGVMKSLAKPIEFLGSQASSVVGAVRYSLNNRSSWTLIWILRYFRRHL